LGGRPERSKRVNRAIILWRLASFAVPRFMRFAVDRQSKAVSPVFCPGQCVGRLMRGFSAATSGAK